MKKKLIVLSGFVLSLSPIVALAATPIDCTTFSGGTLDSILCKIGDLLGLLVPVLITLGIVYFIWGVISYVISDNEEAKKSGKMRMIYGIIGLAVIVAMWGTVRVLTKTFGISENVNTIVVPTVGF